MRVKQTISFYLTFRYILALGLLSILSLGSYFILRKISKTRKQRGNSNISGRQRMLSSGLPYFLKAPNAKDSPEKKTCAGELKEAISDGGLS